MADGRALVATLSGSWNDPAGFCAKNPFCCPFVVDRMGRGVN